MSRSKYEVDQRQVRNVTQATGRSRAGWQAGRGARAIGTARPEVRTTSGATGTPQATRRY
jgi:hypothetical protein